jgi:hypothetical protein
LRFVPSDPAGGALAFVDDDGERVVLDQGEATALLGLTDRLEPATVSACPGCGSRVVAVVALVDVLGSVSTHARARELVELAEDAPTLHLYVRDLAADCEHGQWRDPLSDEWAEAFAERPPVGRLAP